MEVAASHVSSKPVKSGKGFADVVQWTLAIAASNHLNVLRSFGHGVDSSFPLQEKPGKLALHHRYEYTAGGRPLKRLGPISLLWRYWKGCFLREACFSAVSKYPALNFDGSCRAQIFTAC